MIDDLKYSFNKFKKKIKEEVVPNIKGNIESVKKASKDIIEEKKTQASCEHIYEYYGVEVSDTFDIKKADFCGSYMYLCSKCGYIKYVSALTIRDKITKYDKLNDDLPENEQQKETAEIDLAVGGMMIRYRSYGVKATIDEFMAKGIDITKIDRSVA